MPAANEKAAQVLPTPKAAQETTHTDFTPDQKLLATLTARAALAAIVLIPTTDDAGRPVFIASRWALTTQLDSLEAVTVWLDRVTGQKSGVRQ